jgi:predicted transcriptional regulator
MSTVSLSFRTAETTRDALDQIAKSVDRNRNWLINEAIENYLELHRWQIEHIEQSIRHTEAGGRTYSTGEVRSRLARHAESRPKAESR